MNGNKEDIRIDIKEQKNQGNNQFDNDAENCHLYDVKINDSKSFTIKLQAVTLPQLSFRRTKMTIIDTTDKKSVEYYIDSKKTLTGNYVSDDDECIDKIIGILEKNENITLNDKTIKVSYDGGDGKKRQYDAYTQKAKYSFVDENHATSLMSQVKDKMEMRAADIILSSAYDMLKKPINDHVSCCLAGLNGIKSAWKQK